jgi:hypothetical protein
MASEAGIGSQARHGKAGKAKQAGKERQERQCSASQAHLQDRAGKVAGQGSAGNGGKQAGQGR